MVGLKNLNDLSPYNSSPIIDFSDGDYIQFSPDFVKV